MANIDFKLGEWFKQAEKKEKELKEKRNAQKPSAQSTSFTSDPVPMVNRDVSSESKTLVSPSIVASIEDFEPSTNETHVDVKFVGSIGLIDEEDSVIPNVEDYINFEDNPIKPFEYKDSAIITEDNKLASLVEGTGAPKPISKSVEPIVNKKPLVVKETKVKSQSKVEISADNDIKEKWDRMPHHLQVLFATASEEVAQRSYKRFNEDRSELISRLLDPSLSLEETARILNVCPTTVRRYTNRDILPHFRTAGNQRRFRLSDVLNFVESQGKSIN